MMRVFMAVSGLGSGSWEEEEDIVGVVAVVLVSGKGGKGKGSGVERSMLMSCHAYDDDVRSFQGWECGEQGANVEEKNVGNGPKG